MRSARIFLSTVFLCLLCLSAALLPSAANARQIAVFLPDLTFVQAEDGDAVDDPSGSDGMELGTYSWDQATGALTINVAVDTNKDWGARDASAQPLVKTLPVNGNSLGDMTRVISATNQLVGAWGERTPGSATNQALVLTFVDDTHFVLANSGPADAGGHSGIEMGTYTWNPATGAFSTTVIIDTNGDWGLSHSSFSGLTVSGDVMTLTGSSGPVTINKVTSAVSPIVGAWKSAPDSWPGLDTEAPVIALNAPASSDLLKVSPLDIVIRDNNGRLTYQITPTSEPPPADSPDWSPTAPADVTFPDGTGNGTYMIYAWAKNAAGNISAPASASISLSPKLTVSVTTSGNGTVTSSPAGISCVTGTCTALFDRLTPVNLYATPNAGYEFAGWWSTACSGTGTCSFTRYSNVSVSATFIETPYRTRILSTPHSYATIRQALDNAPAGDTVQIQRGVFAEDIRLDSTGRYTLQGGYDSAFSARGGRTLLDGKLTIAHGTLVVDGLTIRPGAAASVPKANAGADQTKPVGRLVTLNGAASSDPKGLPLTYRWSFAVRPAGSTVVMTGDTTASPTFTPDLPGLYTARLIVNNGQFDSAGDITTVTAEATLTVSGTVTPPAGTAQGVFEIISLGSSSASGANGSYATKAYSKGISIIIAIQQGYSMPLLRVSVNGDSGPINTASTAQAIVFMSPYFMTANTTKAVDFLTRIAADQKVAVLAQVIAAVYGTADPLSSTALDQAIADAITSVWNSLPDAPAPQKQAAVPKVLFAAAGSPVPYLTEYADQKYVKLTVTEETDRLLATLGVINNSGVDWIGRINTVNEPFTNWDALLQKGLDNRATYTEWNQVGSHVFIKADPMLALVDFIDAGIKYLTAGTILNTEDAAKPIPIDTSKPGVYVIRAFSGAKGFGIDNDEYNHVVNNINDGSAMLDRAFKFNCYNALMDALQAFLPMPGSKDGELIGSIVGQAMNTLMSKYSDLPPVGQRTASDYAAYLFECVKEISANAIASNQTEAVGNMFKRLVGKTFIRTISLASKGKAAAVTIERAYDLYLGATPMETTLLIVGNPVMPEILDVTSLRGTDTWSAEIALKPDGNDSYKVYFYPNGDHTVSHPDSPYLCSASPCVIPGLEYGVSYELDVTGMKNGLESERGYTSEYYYGDPSWVQAEAVAQRFTAARLQVVVRENTVDSTIVTKIDPAKFNWTSNNTSLATIDATGVVRAGSTCSDLNTTNLITVTSKAPGGFPTWNMEGGNCYNNGWWWWAGVGYYNNFYLHDPSGTLGDFTFYPYRYANGWGLSGAYGDGTLDAITETHILDNAPVGGPTPYTPPWTNGLYRTFSADIDQGGTLTGKYSAWEWDNALSRYVWKIYPLTSPYNYGSMSIP